MLTPLSLEVPAGYEETQGWLAVVAADAAQAEAIEIARLNAIGEQADALRVAKVDPRELSSGLSWLRGRLRGDVMDDQEVNLCIEAEAAMEVLPQRHEIRARHEWTVGTELSSIRKTLRTVDADDQTKLEDYYEVHLPDVIKTMKEADGALGYVPWLGRQANDTTLLYVSRLHVETMSELQASKVLQAEATDQIEAFTDGLIHGFDTGYLGSNAIAAIEKAPKVPVLFGDFFLTKLLNRVGFHRPGEFRIIVEPTVDSIREGVGHELGHAVLGRFKQRLFNEATNTHIDRSMKTGEWDIISPTQRQDTNVDFFEERSIVAYMLGCLSRDPVPARMLTRAFSSPVDSQDRRNFNQAVTQGLAHVTPSGANPFDQLEWYTFRLEDKYIEKGASLHQAEHLAMRQINYEIAAKPTAVLSGRDDVRATLSVE